MPLCWHSVQFPGQTFNESALQTIYVHGRVLHFMCKACLCFECCMTWSCTYTVQISTCITCNELTLQSMPRRSTLKVIHTEWGWIEWLEFCCHLWMHLLIIYHSNMWPLIELIRYHTLFHSETDHAWEKEYVFYDEMNVNVWAAVITNGYIAGDISIILIVIWYNSVI